MPAPPFEIAFDEQLRRLDDVLNSLHRQEALLQQIVVLLRNTRSGSPLLPRGEGVTDIAREMVRARTEAELKILQGTLLKKLHRLGGKCTRGELTGRHRNTRKTWLAAEGLALDGLVRIYKAPGGGKRTVTILELTDLAKQFLRVPIADA